jgi:hypothetical protein
MNQITIPRTSAEANVVPPVKKRWFLKAEFFKGSLKIKLIFLYFLHKKNVKKEPTSLTETREHMFTLLMSLKTNENSKKKTPKTYFIYWSRLRLGDKKYYHSKNWCVTAGIRMTFC